MSEVENFDLVKSMELLQRTPFAYKALFYGTKSGWEHVDEGDGTWSAFDIVGHLIHGEKTDWIPRAELILSQEEDKTFEPFDRFAQEEHSKGKTMDKLLDEFVVLRNANLDMLMSWELTQSDLALKGIHPELGEVTLKSLISTWTIHDSVHLNQLTRALIRYYKEDVGPWKAYTRLLMD